MMRVSLARHQQIDSGVPLLAPRGARIIVGGAGDQLATPIVPSAQSLFGPRGICLVAPGGPLMVCDTGHHRLLIWRRAPTADGVPADIVIGQRDFASEGRNDKREIGPATLNVPTGIAFENGLLAVADAWNHRVLLWHGVPERSNQPADVVLGQADLNSGQANRGSDRPAVDTLNWCYGVAIHDGRLLVADAGNRRLLIWDRIPSSHGTPADLVLGQDDFSGRDDGAGKSADGAGMRWPHGIAAGAGRLFVADPGNSRIMVWNRMPKRNGTPCDLVLGQADVHGNDHNRGGANPTAATLNMPYGMALARSQAIIADTANSRLLGFHLDTLATGQGADSLTGQRSFVDKGDNRWSLPARDSLCWPYAVAACDNVVVIADSGNNRILMWDFA
jgi:hypothetical protein